MSIRVSQKKLITIHIFLFVFGIAFLELSSMFRFNKDLHWIYSAGRNYHFLITLPLCFCGSLALAIYSLWKGKENKFLYLIFSAIPLILFLIMIYLTY